jgi:cyanophycin synthetase
MRGRASVRLEELRVLEGPNLYFTRPAIKLTLAVPGWLRASEDRTLALAERVRLPGLRRSAGRPGPPGTEQRRRFVCRVAAHVTRRLAEAAGVRIGVRSRPAVSAEEIVVAYPWRRRDAAVALGAEVVEVLGMLLSARRPVRQVLGEAARRVRRVEPGEGPTVPVPRIPVAMITGTNGKTTTVRLLAHLLGSAGRTVSYTSTDGVYLDGARVEEGDYSGPAGAAMAFAQTSAEAAVLEVARGGILLKGIGAAHNDVAVVTNISQDHLGMLGIHTLDQLAEVKAAITRITRPSGWVVLNADDPRVLSMRRGASARPFLFSLDPDHPAIRQAIDDGGRAVTRLDERLVLLAHGRSLQVLVPVEEVPATLGGVSGQHTQNAMAAAAAALGLGLSPGEVAAGLRSFIPDPELNPGRANLFEMDGRVVVVDYAHNEAGMEGLLEICRGLRAPGRRVWVAYGTAGDRTDVVLHGMGYIAARGADHVAVVELHRYLRGRDPRELVDRLRAGAVDGGAHHVPDFPDELTGLRWALEGSSPGDVIGITALAQRPEIFALLDERGVRVDPQRCRQLARRARGAPERVS